MHRVIVNAKQTELYRAEKPRGRNGTGPVITFPSESQIKPERSTDYNLVQVSQWKGRWHCGRRQKENNQNRKL